MGCFVTFEGVEGSGKTSLCKNVAEKLLARGFDVVLTREPGATPLGAILRELILDPSKPHPMPTAELFLFAADRAQHVAEVIKPAFNRGALILCDRFVHSTLAYQGYGRGLPLEQLRKLNEVASDGMMPSTVLLLDLPAEAGLARASARSGTANPTAADGWNRFEADELAFHRKVRDGFLSLAKDPAERIQKLDALRSQEELLADVLRILEPELAKVKKK